MTLAMLNIFDLPGPEFLLFYLIAFSLCSLASLLLPHLLRFPAYLPMHIAESLSPFDIAYLKSGNFGALRAALTALYNRDLITADGMLHLFTRNGFPAPPQLSRIESKLLAHLESKPLHITELSNLHLGDQFLRPQLLAQQLVLSPARRALLRFATALPLALLLITGLIKIGVGLSREKPVEFLTLLSIINFSLFMILLKLIPRTTLRGTRALLLLKSKNSALQFASRRNKSDNTWSDEALAVALYGINGLRFGSPLALALEIPRPVRSISDAGGSSSCGGGGGGGAGCGGGGGGCGGGGCGGCGGH